MTQANQVQLTLQSDQNGESSTTNLVGQAFQKENSLYVRYTEPPQPPHQEVRTVVKISSDEIKIMRHGGVKSEQVFRVGEQMTGFYRSQATSFAMVTHTLAMHNQLRGVTGRITWEYELYVHEQLSGRFKLSLQIDYPNHTSQ